MGIIILMDAKQIAVLIALLGAATILFNTQATSSLSEFDAWKAKYGVSYSSQFENAYRERIFLENLAAINAHNARNGETYSKGINQFTGLTQEEFEQTYLGFIAPSDYQNIESNEGFTMPNDDIDWAAKGSVTGVKNQGQCGSCWAFSTTGGLEGLWKEEHADKPVASLSESELVDCSSSYGNQACNGGLMTNAFKYVMAKSITTEDEYPYKPVKQTCKATSTSRFYKIAGYVEVKNCDTLAKSLAVRPQSVAVDASNWSSYRGGVLSTCNTRLNHGVTLVGTKEGTWWIKNSWGTSWGEKGFIRLAKGNTCGVCNMASYPKN